MVKRDEEELCEQKATYRQLVFVCPDSAALSLLYHLLDVHQHRQGHTAGGKTAETRLRLLTCLTVLQHGGLHKTTTVASVKRQRLHMNWKILGLFDTEDLKEDIRNEVWGVHGLLT